MSPPVIRTSAPALACTQDLHWVFKLLPYLQAGVRLPTKTAFGIFWCKFQYMTQKTTGKSGEAERQTSIYMP